MSSENHRAPSRVRYALQYASKTFRLTGSPHVSDTNTLQSRDVNFPNLKATCDCYWFFQTRSYFREQQLINAKRMHVRWLRLINAERKADDRYKGVISSSDCSWSWRLRPRALAIPLEPSVR
jgi:hypothetical protein